MTAGGLIASKDWWLQATVVKLEHREFSFPLDAWEKSAVWAASQSRLGVIEQMHRREKEEHPKDECNKPFGKCLLDRMSMSKLEKG